MKYSEFLYHIMENLTSESYWICNVLNNNNIAKQYPEHTAKLQKTINNKLKALKRDSDDDIPTTLFYLSLQYKLPPLETRVKWLKTIAKIHARKGN